MHSIAEIGTNVPAFLGKLWKMIEDPMTNDLISWCSSGNSFVIKDATRLARELLPLYYKHNNMSSFIRQLNMYGFHKVFSTDSKQEIEDMKFTHPHFIRGHPYLLENIKRKITVSRGAEKPTVVNKMLSDVRQINKKQDNLDTRLTAMKRENEALWRELAIMRQKHKKQQTIVNRLIQYLVMLVQTHHLPPSRRIFPLMIKDKTGRSSLDDQNTKTGPIIHELDTTEELEDVDSSIIEPLVSSSESSSEVDIERANVALTKIVEGEDLEENDLTEQFLTASDTAIPVDIRSLADLSNEQSKLFINDVPVTVPTQRGSRKRLNKTVKKKPVKKKKIDSIPLQYVVTNTDNDGFVLVPGTYIASANETLNPVINLNVSTPVEMSPLPKSEQQDWTPSPSPINSTVDALISTPIVESVMSPVMADVASSSTTPAATDSCGILNPELNNMQIACMDNGKSENIMNRFGRIDYMDNHIESVQADLDSLKDLLQTEGISLDANALFGFLGEENTPYLIGNTTDNSMSYSKQKELEGNELMMYSPPLFDLTDLMNGNEWNLPESDDSELASQNTELTTPQFVINNPSFPTPGKTKKS